MRRWSGLVFPVAMLCAALIGGCGQSIPCGVWATASPALAEACADGYVDCSDHCSRYQYNFCPADPPAIGTDEQGVTWARDLFFGLPNPYHPMVECYRGSSGELQASSYQCCYDGAGQLVNEGPSAGTFDFADPYALPGAMFEHFLLDILLYSMCECG